MSSEAIKKFLDGFSVEVTPKAASKIENFEDYIPSGTLVYICLLYTSPSPRDATLSRMPSSA